MRAAKRKITDMTVDELKGVIHEAIAEDVEVWRETFEIMADKRLMRRIRQADLEREAGKEGAFVAWDDLKNASDHSSSERRQILSEGRRRLEGKSNRRH